MIVCRIVPAIRAVRRVVAVRPRPVVKAAIGVGIRRAPRPVMMVCRDMGLGGLLLATAGAAPLPDAAGFTQAETVIEGRDESVGQAAFGAVVPLWSGPWGGFPPPADASPRTGLSPGRAGEMPVPLVTGEPSGGRVAVPEPSSLVLFLAGLLAAPVLRRRYGR